MTTYCLKPTEHLVFVFQHNVYPCKEGSIHITSKIEAKLLFSHLAPSALERHRKCAKTGNKIYFARLQVLL